MSKPASIILEEAKNDYVNAINEITQKHNLSMYFVDIVMGAIYDEIKVMRDQELSRELEAYQQSLKEEKSQKEKDTKK